MSENALCCACIQYGGNQNQNLESYTVHTVPYKLVPVKFRQFHSLCFINSFYILPVLVAPEVSSILLTIIDNKSKKKVRAG